MNLLDLDPRLLRLTSASRAAEGLTREDLRDIARESQSRNSRLGVTGLLLFVGGDFFQVQEGPVSAVEELFEMIESDRRNRWVTRLAAERTLRRAFESWSMGCFEGDASDGSAIFRIGGQGPRPRPRLAGDFSVFLDQFYERNRRRRGEVDFARGL